jgi:hypothetical protein
MNFRSEVLAFAFGALLILVTFGDNHLGRIDGVAIGNLDTIFGYQLWPVMDVIYPAAAIAVFLLYGWVKGGGFRINLATVLLFASFLAVLALVNFDDLAIALNLAVYPSRAYWVAISWIYPVYAAAAFFLFGKLSGKASVHT